VTLSPASRLSIDPHVRFRRFQTEGILIDQKRAEAIVVNEVAVRFYEISDGTRSIAECAQMLADEFDAAAGEIERDLLTFADQLVVQGLAQITS
jgi:hypothetical protein